MKIANTTADFTPYCATDEERVRELHRAGFRYIDLNMYSFKPDCVYMQDNWRDAVLRLKEVADELGVKFVQAHSQWGNPLWEEGERLDFLLKATIRSIEICEVLGIKNTVSHSGHAADIGKEEFFVRNKAFCEKLFPTMERCGVNVLCENSCAVNMAPRYFLNNGRDMREFVDFVDHPLYHACWDTGHGNCEGSQYDEIMAIGDELYAIHYNDNRGKGDDHVSPFMGTLNHDEIINALIDVGFKGYFTLESGDAFLLPGKRRKFERPGKEQKLSRPQLFMQRHVETMMYETAKWMLESYGLFEE